MNLINIEHISKIYGEKVIFDDASFGVQQGDKIGIVGINGTGKSTFLKVVAGEEVPDEGQVVCSAESDISGGDGYPFLRTSGCRCGELAGGK